MDYDLLEAVVKSYDHTTRVVRRLDGEISVSISSVEIYVTLYRAFEEGEEDFIPGRVKKAWDQYSLLVHIFV